MNVSATTPRNMWAAAQDVLREQQSGPALVRVTQRRVPLSSSQERLWFIAQSQPGTAAYNLPFAWRLRGDVSATALREAFSAVMRRHTIFQTVFGSENGLPFQSLAGFVPLEITQRDFRHVAETQRYHAVQEWMREQAAQPFDLSQLPLLRVALLQIGAREFVLFAVFHHIVFDGWSRQVFFRELKAHYVASLTGTPASLPEPQLQFADFAVWDRARAEGIAERQLDFWKQILASTLPILDLPLDHPRPATASGRGAVHHFLLTSRTCAALDELRSETGTTRFVALLSAFEALLHRYSEQEDIIVGTASANRTRPELRQMIGFFVNTLALRSHPATDMPFRELLHQTQQVVADAFAHQEVPFEKVVKAVKPARTAGQSPIFNTLFVLQNASRTELELPGVEVRPMRVHNGTAKFDLTFELRERGMEISGAVEFNTDVFDAPTVRWMSRHFAQLLDSALASPDTPLARLPMFTPRERRLLVQWNETSAPYPRDRAVHELFEDNAARLPEATAIECGQESWSYAQLNGTANALSKELLAAGVQPGALVGICAERSPFVVAAMIAVSKAGGAYVPLDPKYPAERLGFMMADLVGRVAPRAPFSGNEAALVASSGGRGATRPTGPLVVLVQRKHRHLLADSGARLLLLDDARLPSSDNPKSPSCGDSVAHVLYTSGSTGKPKGVCITHRGISRLVLNTNYVQIKPHDVVAQAASISFDAATLEIWGALLNGAQLVIIPREVSLSPRDLAAELRSRGVTVLFLTTALFNVMARAEPEALAAVRCVMFGGEAADAVVVRELIERGAPEKLLNLYGPTETTTLATWFDARQLDARASNVPIGLPVANTDVNVFDKQGHIAPIGVRGELCIGGDGVANGYWNQPELTAEKFVERDVFGTRRRLYRSGDIVRRLPDGNIEFVGRADNQVKIRGFRVELGEIESALKQHTAVREAVVVLHGDGSEKRVIAYVTLRSEARTTGDDLRRWLAPKLPEHMLPSQVILLATLPINANGKVDRNALPRPDEQTRASVVEVKPWIPLQLQLLQIWRELLGVKNIGVRDNFFELGGHSLLAVRLMDRIEHVCGVKVPVGTLFTASTVEQLSEAILKQQFGAAKPLIEIQPAGTRAPILFLHGDLLGGGLYCLSLARHLGTEHPFFALPPARVDGARVPTIAEMATEHLRVVRARNPHGPYVLGGFCIAGLVALEMAQRLEADGERVEMLVLADPPVPSYLGWARRVVESGARLGHESFDDQLQDFLTCYRRLCLFREFRALSLRQQWQFIRRRMARKRNERVSPSGPSATRDLQSAYLWAAAGYTPRRYSGSAQLFCCDDVMVPLKRKLRAWQRLLPRAETHVIAGEHLDLVTTHADQLARRMRVALTGETGTGELKAATFCTPLANAHQ